MNKEKKKVWKKLHKEALIKLLKDNEIHSADNGAPLQKNLSNDQLTTFLDKNKRFKDAFSTLENLKRNYNKTVDSVRTALQKEGHRERGETTALLFEKASFF